MSSQFVARYVEGRIA